MIHCARGQNLCTLNVQLVQFTLVEIRSEALELVSAVATAFRHSQTAYFEPKALKGMLRSAFI